MNKKMIIVIGIIFALVFIGLLSTMFAMLTQKQSDNTVELANNLSVNDDDDDISKYDGMKVSTVELVDMINSKAFHKCSGNYIDNEFVICINVRNYSTYRAGNCGTNSNYTKHITGNFYNKSGKKYSNMYGLYLNSNCYQKVTGNSHYAIYTSKEYVLGIMTNDATYIPGKSLVYGIYATSVS